MGLSGVASADIVGSNPYAALPTLDTCSGCVFGTVDFSAANAGQNVESYQFYNGAGAGTTNMLTPILFEKTASRTLSILGIGETGSGFAAGYNTIPFVLASGSATVLDGNTFFGYVDGSASGIGNTGTIVSNYGTGGGGVTSYFAEPSGALSVGKPLAVNSFTDTPFPSQNNRTYSLQVTTGATPPASADPGSDPHVNLGTLDTCSGCSFAYVDFSAANAGQTVTSYQFFNGAGAGTSNKLTPILYEKTGARSFEILGIGETSTGFAAGYNNLPFVLTQGTDKVLDANTYFGYVDGTASGLKNTGTITSNYSSGGGGPVSYFAEPAGVLKAGEVLTDYAFTDVPFPDQNNRTYSLSVDAETVTPEPALYGLLGAGLLSLAFSRRGRKVNSRA